MDAQKLKQLALELQDEGIIGPEAYQRFLNALEENELIARCKLFAGIEAAIDVGYISKDVGEAYISVLGFSEDEKAEMKKGKPRIADVLKEANKLN